VAAPDGRTKGAERGELHVWSTGRLERTSTADLVSFDAHEVSRGENRFAEGPDGLVPVAPGRDVMAWQLHAESCSLTRK
jgi:hypothetical protein